MALIAGLGALFCILLGLGRDQKELWTDLWVNKAICFFCEVVCFVLGEWVGPRSRGRVRTEELLYRWNAKMALAVFSCI